MLDQMVLRPLIESARETSWKHEWFFTHKRLPSKELDDMALSAEQYRLIGENVVARLLALSGRVK
jgi:hypothetical protein